MQKGSLSQQRYISITYKQRRVLPDYTLVNCDISLFPTPYHLLSRAAEYTTTLPHTGPTSFWQYKTTTAALSYAWQGSTSHKTQWKRSTRVPLSGDVIHVSFSAELSTHLTAASRKPLQYSSSCVFCTAKDRTTQ